MTTLFIIVGVIVGFGIIGLVILAASFWLRHQFHDLSRKALRQTSEEFLQLARQQLDLRQSEGSSELEKKQHAVEHAVSGLVDQLRRYEDLIKQLESDRERKYGFTMSRSAS